ncbi:hypothetical protein ACWWD9_07240 [Methylovorus sp. SPW-M1]
MKWIAGAIAVLALILIINEPKYRRHEEAINRFMEQSTNVSAEMKRQAEQSRVNSYNAEKIKLFVPGRDSKTCMEILEVNEINNRVVECNKDHYVEMRRDEVTDFKKEQRLP